MENPGIKFRSFGKGCQISPFARFYNPENIEIGDNVRIDDFCILSADEFGIKIGSHIHIGCHITLLGKEQIILDDYSGLSSRVSIFSSTDDFSGNFLVGPYKHLKLGKGGTILTDNEEAYKWFKRARFSGRNEM